ncbi:DNA helicase RecQ [Cytophagaceae bacterium ABcell3]|nr:DNA helicase RecQ [Cytophagaceae bacterium ABcell3]
MHTKESVLKDIFGYNSFRPLQEDIINHVLSGNDALVLMPTGGGKSLCFQIPALVMDGICVVISPLISLMKDQTEQLNNCGVKSAFINSSMSYQEVRDAKEACISGTLKLLYVSPEKIFSDGFIDFLKKLKINLFAIDEAHCVSFWGHDFRPEYTKLKELKEAFPSVPLIALTATADKLTRKDILDQLGLPEAKVFITSFDRPNISLSVSPGNRRLEKILNFLNGHKNESGIIYCLSRKATEKVAENLRNHGLNAEAYHAGLNSQIRSDIQERFIKDDIEIVCATIAFGMGINKPNVRWVIHYNLPKNVENFYQEIGRAGRDGLPSDTLLFYSHGDMITHMTMLAEASDERKKLQEAKLKRMMQYAETPVCRRRILLSYFNEETTTDCGNCDVCRNPRKLVDATIPAMKALSAIARTGEKVGIGLLTDILRGSHNRNIISKGYDKIKTFGAGKDLKTEEWHDYLQQMLNAGIVDIAYDENHVLKLNNTSWKVLKENLPVKLVKLSDQGFAKTTKHEPVKSANALLYDELFERLRKLRKELADNQNVPAYIVFSDVTLKEMAEQKPSTPDDLLEITGVGKQKFNLYGDYFLHEIQTFIKEHSEKGKKIKGSTYVETFNLYKEGLSMEEIAKERNLNIITIASHLVYLYEKGHAINLKKYITQEEIEKIKKAVEATTGNYKEAKPIFEYFNGEINYDKIRIALALLKKESLVKE